MSLTRSIVLVVGAAAALASSAHAAPYDPAVLATANFHGFDEADLLAMSAPKTAPSTYGALQTLAIRDAESQRRGNGGVPMFAVPHGENLTPDTAGKLVDLGNGRVQWRLPIQSDNARSINLGMDFKVPDSTIVFLLDSEGNTAYEPYTADDVAAHGELWTPPVEGVAMQLLVEVDAHQVDELRRGIRVHTVNLAFMDFGETFQTAGVGRSAACHVDVACAQADPWRVQVDSVGVYTLSGFFTCSGAMINNTAEDSTPYFMSANHCGPQNNPASMVVFWNFQHSFCRTPGSGASGAGGNGSLSQNQSGAFFRMTYQPADYTLVELDSLPNPAHGVEYAGWDRTSSPMSSGVGIHHPGTEEKRISVENNAAVGVFTSIGGPTIEAWRVQFDQGGIEQGSSGSPLFNQAGRVVGTATGVDTLVACFPQLTSYGKLVRAWNGGGTSSSRLSDWLDPIGTGQTTLDALGVDPAVPEPFALLAPANGAAPTSVTPTLDWQDSANAASYRVTLDDDSDLSSPVIDVVLTESELEIFPGQLEQSTTYHWNVVASNLFGTETASPGTATFTTLIDCNDNQTDDLAEIAAGDVEDCNNNNQPDSCELDPTPFADDSGDLGPIGLGFSQQYVLSSLSPSTGDVTLTFFGQGDFSSSSELVQLSINGQFFGSLFINGDDCSGAEDQETIVLTKTEFNDLIDASGGSLTFDFNATSNVNPNACGGLGTHVRVETEYGSVEGSADLDANGILDACENIGDCPGDLNTTGTTNGTPDGITNLSDLQFYLTNYQNDFGATPGSIADLNTTGTTNGTPDGLVNLSDLQFYLTQWQSGLTVCP